jgi:hypothetical protein
LWRVGIKTQQVSPVIIKKFSVRAFILRSYLLSRRLGADARLPALGHLFPERSFLGPLHLISIATSGWQVLKIFGLVFVRHATGTRMREVKLERARLPV